ncbi:MAG: hypothetical protein DPW09_29425, partial [Anaerolineae bacterium]|nr:hypothetical protein [Anaerolineae bacterium]
MAEPNEKQFNPNTARPLLGCVDAETAFVQTDYPYGRRLRCQRRVWVETKPRHGMRLVTQTSNPRRAGLVWNAPHPETYQDLIALWVDDKGFIQTDSLNNLSYHDLADLDAWARRNQAFLASDKVASHKFEQARRKRAEYEASLE